jgi:hypothetical protein
MRGISWLTANQLAVQEGLCTVEWVSNKTWIFFCTIFPRVHWRWWRVWHINLCMDCCSSFYSALFVKAQNCFTCQYPPLHVLVKCVHRSLSAITYNTHQEVQNKGQNTPDQVAITKLISLTSSSTLIQYPLDPTFVTLKMKATLLPKRPNKHGHHWCNDREDGGHYLCVRITSAFCIKYEGKM